MGWPRRTVSRVLPTIPATALVATLLVVAPWALRSHASVLGACNPIDPPPSPGGLNVPYKTISSGELVLDVYRPPGAGPFPAIVLAHGGGYRSGCKGKTASEARFIADQGFVTFNISYRLACDEAHPPPDVQDPGVECWGPGVAGLSNRDMRDAVAWVRDNGVLYEADPARVALLGFSSGGGIALMAAANGTPGGSRPDVVASWSGGMELGYLTDGVTPACTYSEDPGCMQKREDYIGCPLAGTGACPGKWYTLSPYTAYPADGPPVFLANATHELVALVEAVDMQHRLAELGVPRQFCKVKGSSHATGYEDLPCAGDATTSVFEATLTFIGAHLPDQEGGVVELGSRGAWTG